MKNSGLSDGIVQIKTESQFSQVEIVKAKKQI